MTKPMTPGERVQREMEMYRGPQKEQRPQHISKPAKNKPKPSFKASRGK